MSSLVQMSVQPPTTSTSLLDDRNKTARNTVVNALLRQLSPNDREEIQKYAAPFRLPRRQVIQERHTALRYVYFIESGAASMLAKTGSDRANVEVQTLGMRDFVGVPLLHGVEMSPHRCVMQVEGTALRLEVADFARLQTRLPDFRNILLRYSHDVFVHSSQLVACNTRHNLCQRLARWLLVASDRLASDRLALTHDGLSRAIAVRRSGVTTEMGRMEQAGLIRRGRGAILIVNREGLEAISCGCHRVLRAATAAAAPTFRRASSNLQKEQLDTHGRQRSVGGATL